MYWWMETVPTQLGKKKAEIQFIKADLYVQLLDRRAMEILHQLLSTLKYI